MCLVIEQDLYINQRIMLRGVLNNEDIKGHILSGSLWGLTASGLFKKARPARPQPFLRAERTGTT